MNILGHEFKLIITNDLVKRYICSKCNADVDKIISSNMILMWNEEYNDYVDLISCDEMIIKNILE